jgi:hypothetical protein
MLIPFVEIKDSLKKLPMVWLSEAEFGFFHVIAVFSLFYVALGIIFPPF